MPNFYTMNNTDVQQAAYLCRCCMRLTGVTAWSTMPYLLALQQKHTPSSTSSHWIQTVETISHFPFNNNNTSIAPKSPGTRAREAQQTERLCMISWTGTLTVEMQFWKKFYFFAESITIVSDDLKMAGSRFQVLDAATEKAHLSRLNLV